MPTVEDHLAAIESHTRGLAAAAEGRLDARIEHCPDWSMADLVWHVAQVHWFWNQVAVLRPAEAPEDLVRPARPADDVLISTLLANVAEMVDTLRGSDQNAACWTWGLEENVGFITRHQVQEAAIHHWDAVNAAGSGGWEMDGLAAADAVEEFLTHSVANTRWPATGAEPLGGPLELGPWVVRDGDVPGTLTHEAGDGELPAPALLLWLYRRIEDPGFGPGADAALLTRFRAFTNTD